MTKRQRALAEEETPLGINQIADTEEIKRALERIDELKFWVEERRSKL
tara:strand:- start:318 stop:461 length:144 start_codon:yes stop_codon:yes gene_type:complete